MAFDLARFRHAQEDGSLDDALAELRAGRKESHWVWFVFPQLRGLGSSPLARQYGLDGPEEAAAYLQDPVLRRRLLAVTEVVHENACARGVPLVDLMGWEIDALKLVSSLTLFEPVAAAALATAADEDARRQLERLAALAREVLAVAERQGFPRCAFTLARLRPS